MAPKTGSKVVKTEKSLEDYRDEAAVARRMAEQALGAYRLAAFDREVRDRALYHVLSGAKEHCETCSNKERCLADDTGSTRIPSWCYRMSIEYMEKMIRQENEQVQAYVDGEENNDVVAAI